MTRLIAVLVLARHARGRAHAPAGADAATDAAVALGAFGIFDQALWPYRYWGYGYGWPFGYVVRSYA